MSLESTDAQVNELITGASRLSQLMDQGYSRDQAEMILIRNQRGPERMQQLRENPKLSLSRGAEVMLDASERGELAAAGINAETYQAGTRFDNENAVPGDPTKLAFIRDNDQSDLQNFGGVDKQGRTKDANAAIEEQSRSRMRQNVELSISTPTTRPGVDEYLDDLVKQGIIDDQTANRRAYAMKQQGITDPIGEEMKNRDFGVTYTPERTDDPNYFPGRQQVRNERGYKGQFIWRPTGDLQMPAPATDISLSGTYVQDSQGRLVRERMGQYAGTGFTDADGNVVISRDIAGTGAGLQLNNPGMGENYTIKGGTGEWVQVPKGQEGIKRYRASEKGDQVAGTFSDGKSAMMNAAQRLKSGLENGTIPEDQRSQAIALLGRLELQLDPREQIRAEKALTRDMVLADNAPGKINQEVRERNLRKAVEDAEIANQAPAIRETLPNGLMPVMHESADRFMMEDIITDAEARGSDPSKFPTAQQRGGTFVDNLNIPISNESPAVDALYRAMAGLKDGQIEDDLLTSAQRWMREGIIDQRDYDAGGNYDVELPPMDIGAALDELNSAFATKKIKTDIRSADDLERATQIYRATKKNGNIWTRDPVTGKPSVIKDPTTADILTDMKITSPAQKRIARALFTLESSKASPVNQAAKEAYFQDGTSMARSEQPVRSEDITSIGTVGAEKVDGKSVAAEFRKLDPEKRVRNQVASEIQDAESFLKRKLNSDEINEITGRVREENRALDADGNPEIRSDVADMRMPNAGITEGGQAGRRGLSGQVYQGRDNDQIQVWYAKKGRPQKEADAAIASASRLRDWKRSVDENNQVVDFVSRTVDLSPAARESFVDERGNRISAGKFDKPGQVTGTPRFVPGTRPAQPIAAAPVQPSIAPDPGMGTGNQATPAVDAGRGGALVSLRQSKASTERPSSYYDGSSPYDVASSFSSTRRVPGGALVSLRQSAGNQEQPSRYYDGSSEYDVTSKFTAERQARKAREASSPRGMASPFAAEMAKRQINKRAANERMRGRAGYAALGAGTGAVLAGILGGGRDDEEELYR